jgi:hypothetical protein
MLLFLLLLLGWRPGGLRRRRRPVGLRRLMLLLNLRLTQLGLLRLRHNGGTRRGNRGLAVRS